jgi:hypothetical protein
MTQAARPTLNAAVDDGITLATKFNNALAALYTNHAGAAAPPSPELGQPWVDTSGEGGSPSLHVMKIYDGTTFRTMGTLNRTAGTYSVAGNLSLTGGSLTGPILAAYGTAAAPGVAFNGDSNTGIYRAAADQLGLATAGALRMSVSASEVAITSPALSVTAGSPNFALNRSSGAAGSSLIRFQSGGTNRYQFNVSGAESSGNAGSDFYLQSYDDAGSLLSNMLHIKRSTKQIGLNGLAVGSATLTVRSNAATTYEVGVTFLNANSGDNALFVQEFATGSNATRSSIQGGKEGATNNGYLSFNTYVGGTASQVLYLGSNKKATFSGDVESPGEIRGFQLTSTGNINATNAGFSGNLSVAGSGGFGSSVNSESLVVTGAGSGLSFTNFAYDGNYVTGCLQHNNLGGFTPSMQMCHISGQWYGFRLNTSNGDRYFEIQNSGVIVRSGDSYQVQWVSPSDERIKKDITPISEDALSLINQVNVVSFNWNRELEFAPQSDSHTRAGFVAQQLQEVFPEAVVSRPVAELEGGMLSADPGVLIPWLVRAVQQLTARVAELEGGT